MICTIKTPLGSELIVHEASDHFKDGVILTLRVLNNNKSDTYRVEILLDQESLKELRTALEDFQKD
jgi:hypothetical protein